MQRKQVMALYRAKLDVCKRMGYESGNWDNKYIFNYEEVKSREVKRLIRKNLIGTVIWNNVRFRYKINKKESGVEYLRNVTDYGFVMLKWINLIEVLYIGKRQLLLN